MENDELQKAIKSRRSVRVYDVRPVPRETLDALIEAARWAPSGLNNQPWRFVTIEKGETLEELAKLTKYGKILRGAGAAVAVFLDTGSLYNRTKDLQGVGAALQNLLLAAHGAGLGACWLGEILNRREEVERALGVSSGMELMAVVTLGYPKKDAKAGRRDRLPLESLIIGRH